MNLQSNAKNLNGLNIAKLRMNSQFKVTTIDKSLLQLRVITDISIGDIIMRISNVDIQSLNTKDAAMLL